jgi:hypothetical protein
VSYNTRRIVALAVVLLAATSGGLLAVAITDSPLATVLGVVTGAVVGMILIVTWINRSS